MLQTDIQNFYRSSALNYINYWGSCLDANPHPNELSAEKDNLLLAFQKGIELDMPKMAVRAHAIFDFFETQGLYTKLRTILHYIERISERVDRHETIAQNYVYLGIVEFRLENFETARGYFRAGLQYATEKNLAQQAGKIEFELSQLDFEFHQYDQAIEHLQSALKKAETSSNVSDQCAILANLGKIACFQDNFNLALHYCNLGLPIARENGFDGILASFYTYIGGAEYSQGEKATSYASMKTGLEYARKSGEIVRLNNLLTNLGSVATELGYLDAAADYLDEALSLSKRLGSSGYIAHILLDLGLLKCKLGEEEQGLIYMSEAVTSAREFNDWSLLMHTLNKRGTYLIEQEEYQLAIADWEELIALDTPENDRVTRQFAAAYWQLAQANLALGEKEKAINHASESLERFNTLKATEDAAQITEWVLQQEQ